MTGPVDTLDVGLSLQGRRVVVVGGGTDAQRCVARLLSAEARVEVVAPEVTPTVESLDSSGRLTWAPRDFRPTDVDAAWYCVAASGDADLDARVARAAEGARVFCEVLSGSAGASARDLAVDTGGSAGGHPPEVETPVPDATSQLRGTVALVGGGPGADDLLTLRGLRLLEQADVVVADRLAPQAPLGRLRAGVELVDAAKIPYGRSMAQEAINEVLVDRARRGAFVVRLKGGDPFLFGRGYEEAMACAEAGIRCTVVPGVTSALAVPALGGMPVTHRGVTHDLTVVSGHLPPGHPQSLVDWDALGRMRGTVVALMAVKNAGPIAEAMVAAGRDPLTPAAVIVDGSLEGQSTHRCTLGTLAGTIASQALRPPAILVVGDVVALPEALTDI